MKKIKHLTQFAIINILFFLFKILGFKISSYLGYLIGRFIGPIFKPKTLIIKNLEKANIESNHKDIASNVLGNYGRILAEYVHLKNFRNDKLKNYISIDGIEYLQNIKKNKQKVVFISGHFNNFELMAMEIDKSNINLATIYRPLNNFFLDKIIVNLRKNFICKNQLIKGISGVRESFKLFKEGFSLALMIDQRLSEGIKLNFFGKIASTTTLPAQFVKKFNADIVPVHICRTKNSKFKMKIHKPLVFEKNEKIDTITIHLNQWLEKEITKHPDQWIWSHNRWKI